MSKPLTDDMNRTPNQPLSEQALDQIRQSLRGLSYGVVSIIVQDGVVVQIERTEKRRLRKADTKP